MLFFFFLQSKNLFKKFTLFYFLRLFAELYCAQFYCIFPVLLLLLYSYLFCRHLWNFNSHFCCCFAFALLSLPLSLSLSVSLSLTHTGTHTRSTTQIRTCARTRTRTLSHAICIHYYFFICFSLKFASHTQLHSPQFRTHLHISPCGFSRLAAHLILFCHFSIFVFLLVAFFSSSLYFSMQCFAWALLLLSPPHAARAIHDVFSCLFFTSTRTLRLVGFSSTKVKADYLARG